MSTALTIAGSDSSGGAGIQADLKTFAACSVDGVCAITAVTAQNTVGITAVHTIPADIVAAQISTVTVDIGVAAVKTGMLATREIVAAVAESIRTVKPDHLVVDPVMVSTSGIHLLEEDAVATLVEELLPYASCVTPNLDEAERLSGRPIESDGDRHEAARRIVDLGSRAVVLTGGDRDTETVVDLFYDGEHFLEFEGPRLGQSTTHGTGCMFSAAITAGLARGQALVDSVQMAKHYVSDVIRHGVDIGPGRGPVGPNR